MPKLVAGSSLGFDDFTLIRVRVSLFVIYLLIDQAESFEKSLFFKYKVGFCFLKLLPFQSQRDRFQSQFHKGEKNSQSFGNAFGG
jgi:hypothetical protein